MGIGIGIGMETPDLRAGWPRGGFDAAQNRIFGLAAAPPRGGAEACVIVTGYFREKFFKTNLINYAPLLEPKNHEHHWAPAWGCCSPDDL